MSPLRSRFAPLLACLAILGCAHSDPFTPPPQGSEGSFDQVEPIQLTFATTDDAFPTYSRDGRWLSYRFARGTLDRDQCAGALPAAGGQRVEEICAWELDQGTRSDDIRSLVILGSDRMAFTRYRSATGNQAPQEGGLYLGPLGQERDAVLVLPLLARPAGASDTWTYLLDPIASGEDELLVLAAKAYIGQRVQFGPVDTVYQGVEFARINLAANPATITTIAPATNAVSWQLDENSGRIYYHRRYYSAPLGSGESLVVADTIFRVPLAGGAAEAVWGRPRVVFGGLDIELGQGMGGFGIGGGRLFVSLWDRRQPASIGGTIPSPETRARILEIIEGGETTLNTRLSTSQSIWTRLSVSRDGRLLAAGSVTGGQWLNDQTAGGQRDLYLFKVAP